MAMRKQWYGRIFTSDIVLDAKDVDRLPKYIQILDEDKNHLITVATYLVDFEYEDGDELGDKDDTDLKNYLAGR